MLDLSALARNSDTNHKRERCSVKRKDTRYASRDAKYEIMEYAVETFSLTKIFSDWWGRDKVYAVDDLNLQVHYNEVFGLLGPNGSGKTTTLK